MIEIKSSIRQHTIEDVAGQAVLFDHIKKKTKHVASWDRQQKIDVLQ